MHYVGYSIAYPIMIMSSNVGSFGVFGLSLTLLIIALIGGGQYKLGGLFLGMVIAVHPFLGAFCILIVMITFLWDYKNQQENLNKFFIFFWPHVLSVPLVWDINYTCGRTCQT